MGTALGDGAAFAAKLTACRCTGMDISAELIEQAKLRHAKDICKGKVEYKMADAQCLDVNMTDFSLIFSEAAFCRCG